MALAISRRRLLKYGLLGSISLGVSSACSEWPLTGPNKKSLAWRTTIDHALVVKLAPSVIGISRTSFELIKVPYLQQLEEIHDKLPPVKQTDLLDMLRLLDFFGFRWCYGVFTSWDAASDIEAERFMKALSESNITFLQIVYQHFTSLVTSTYYALPESWKGIGFPNNVIMAGLYE